MFGSLDKKLTQITETIQVLVANQAKTENLTQVLLVNQAKTKNLTQVLLVNQDKMLARQDAMETLTQGMLARQDTMETLTQGMLARQDTMEAKMSFVLVVLVFILVIVVVSVILGIWNYFSVRELKIKMRQTVTSINTLQLCVNPRYSAWGGNDYHPIVEESKENYAASMKKKDEGQVLSYMRTRNRNFSSSGVLAVGCHHATLDILYCPLDDAFPVIFPLSLLGVGVKRVFVYNPDLCSSSSLDATDLVVLELDGLPSGVDMDKLPVYEDRIKGEIIGEGNHHLLREGTPVFGRTRTGFITAHSIARHTTMEALYYYTCVNTSVESESGDSGSLMFALSENEEEAPRPFGVVRGSASKHRLGVSPLVPFEKLVPFSPIRDTTNRTLQVFKTRTRTSMWYIRDFPAPSGDFPPSFANGKGFFGEGTYYSGVLIGSGGYDWSAYHTRVLRKKVQQLEEDANTTHSEGEQLPEPFAEQQPEHQPDIGGVETVGSSGERTESSGEVSSDIDTSVATSNVNATMSFDDGRASSVGGDEATSYGDGSGT